METLKTAQKELQSAGFRTEILQLDVTDLQRVDLALGALEPFQILVNNAGMNRPKHLVEVKNEDIDAVFDLNIKVAFYVTRKVTQQLSLQNFQALSLMYLLKWVWSGVLGALYTVQVNML
jgi:NADP-dependent 3-hydroxy acid dehydrogenase YdfG